MSLLFSQGGRAPGEEVHLTQEQTEALWWATSAEGKCDRNLMQLNLDSLVNAKIPDEEYAIWNSFRNM